MHIGGARYLASRPPAGFYGGHKQPREFYPEAVFPDQKMPEGSAFLAKPFMPEELIDAVDGLLGTAAGVVVLTR